MIINKKVSTKKVENKTNNIVTYNNRKIKNQKVIENYVITVNGQNNKIISPITTNLHIGNGNLFASDITIWGRNDHVIYDIDTGEQLNGDKQIYIGDNNWVCNNVSFLPGGIIKNNCVVGYGTLLNKEFCQNNVLIAGAPPKVRRENINWSVSSDIDRIDKNNNLKIKEKEI